MNKRIGLKLILQISSLVILICIALTTITYMRVSSMMTDNIKTSLESDSVNTVKLLSKEFEEYKLQLELLARNEQIKTMDWIIQEEVLKKESEIQGVSFQVSETSGLSKSTNGASFDISDKLNFKLTMETGNTIVTPPLLSSGNGELIIVITTPIKNNQGATIGVLGTVIDALEFNKIVGEQKSSENGFTIVLDSKGQVVAHEDTQLIKDGVNHLELYKNESAYEEYVLVVEKMIKGENDFAKIKYNEESFFIAYYPMADMNWSLGILVPESDFIQDVYELRNIMIGLMFVFIIIGAIVAFLIAQSIKNPLQKMMVFAKELESGNMLYRLNLNRKDEIGQIGVSLNEMGDSIKNLMVDVADSSDSILNSTESFTTIIAQTSQAANEISKSAQEMATTNEAQASDLLKGLNTVEELSKRIEDVYDSINDISGISSESSIYNKNGLNAVEDLVDKTEKTTSQVKEVHEIVTTVDTSMDVISTITSTISVIADQTNLLALNAAIESARAGEAGKGFAVVSDEIRKLAEQSSKSANEIQTLINDIQSQSKIAVKSINETEIVVDLQANAVEEVGNIFKTLSKLIENQIRKIAETQKLNESMNHGKDTILSMIENLSATAEENAASTEEVYATTEQQSEGMSEVDDYASALKDLAINLKKNLDHFTIN